MAIVAGVDFGTQSVRVSLVDSEIGILQSASAEYPVHRKSEDPEYATQSHADHMTALVAAMRSALDRARVPGQQVQAIALDTTGSTIIPVGEKLEPLDEYYLWCDHRAKREAAEITLAGVREGLQAIQWCGGVYSSEWGFSKLLHWLRHNPEKRSRLVSVFEHCDMVAATLCGITEAKSVKRSICAMGHKWMWNAKLGGLPPESFLTRVDPLFEGICDKLEGEFATSDKIAGNLCAEWAGRLGVRAGIPIPVGAIDAHWDAIGAGAKASDVVNVIGTSTCIIATTNSVGPVPGVCGVVQGSVHPQRTGVEAGITAVGDIFNAIARRAGTDVGHLSQGLERYRAGQTGLIRIGWDNGDRSILVNPNLRGVTLGWNLQTSAQDELFAAIEGTAFQTRIILEHMKAYHVCARRIINGGGIPLKNEVLNQVYANVLGRPVLVPSRSVVGLGAAIFAFLAAGAFDTVEEAQERICPPHRTYLPSPTNAQVYDEMYEVFKTLYSSLGHPRSGPIGQALPRLVELAESVRRKEAE